MLRAQWKFKLLIGFLSAKVLRAPSHLCTEAIQLDMIQTWTGLLADRIGVNHDLMELIRPTFLTGETYFNGQPTFEVLLRVLIQDCFEEHWKRADSPNCQPIPFDRVKESFQHWIKYHIASRSYELESSIAFMEASEEIMQFFLSSPLFPDAYSIMPFYFNLWSYCRKTQSSYQTSGTETSGIKKYRIRCYSSSKCQVTLYRKVS